MTVGVKQWLECEFVRTLSTGKELRYRMFLSTGGELYAVVDLNGASRRVWPDGYGGYLITMRCMAMRGKIRVRAPGLLWLQDQTAGYMAFMRGLDSTPPVALGFVRGHTWLVGWYAGHEMHKGIAP